MTHSTIVTHSFTLCLWFLLIGMHSRLWSLLHGTSPQRRLRLYIKVVAAIAFVLAVSHNYETTVGSSSPLMGTYQQKLDRIHSTPPVWTDEEANEFRFLSNSTGNEKNDTAEAPANSSWTLASSDSDTAQNHAVKNESFGAQTINLDNGTSMGTTTDDPKALVYVPLQPWEYESIQPSRTCQPPLGTPDYCCLGSLSTTGHLYYAAEPCNHTLDVYETTEQIALTSMPLIEWPELGVTQQSSGSTIVQCDVCRMVDILMEQNWTLAMQGDSMTRQSFFGLECELRRRNLYQVEMTQIRWPPRKTREDSLADVHEMRISPLSTDASSNTSSNVAVLRYFAMFRSPEHDMSELETHILGWNPDILIFDHGLHMGPGTGREFVPYMRRLVPALLNGTKSWKLLAWRETSAQHFETKGGHFSWRIPWGCVPHSKHGVDSQKSNVLRPLMEQILAELNVSSSQLQILPFRDYTSQFHDLHAPSVQDCSHFCSTPSFWLPLWRTLRNAMDKVVVALESGETTSSSFQ
jgi:hypothetical protein